LEIFFQHITQNFHENLLTVCFAGIYIGKRKNQWGKSKNPPFSFYRLHPNCRCVLIPATEITDMGEDIPRPAANADFMALTKEEYEKNIPAEIGKISLKAPGKASITRRCRIMKIAPGNRHTVKFPAT
jgi:hypothetical protein